MPARYIYIGGYSRSGSTLLDILLGSHPEMVGTGELTYLFDDYRDDRLCTCGVPYRQCPFWQDVPGGQRAGEPAALVRAVERRAGLARLTAGDLEPSLAEAYGAANASLFEHIRQVSGRSVIVDSSKNARDAAGRPFALDRHAGEVVHIVHVVRSLSDTVESYLRRGSNWRMEGRAAPRHLLGWRAMVGWRLANGIAVDLGDRLGAGRYLRLGYETLVGDPLAALDTLETFLGIDLAPLARRVRDGDAFHAGHNVGGNRMRHEPLRLAAQPVPLPRLPWPYRLGVHMAERGALAGPASPGARPRP